MRMCYPRVLLWLRAFLLLLIFLMLTACDEMTTNLEHNNTKTNGDLLLTGSVSSKRTSVVHFSLTSAEHGELTFTSSVLTSRLSYGSQELTILVSEQEKAFLLSFQGYTGPGSYTLAPNLNEATVSLTLGTDHPHWELSHKQAVACQLVVESEVRTETEKIHRLSGAFACEKLTVNTTDNYTRKTVAIVNGSFDIAILLTT